MVVWIINKKGNLMGKLIIELGENKCYSTFFYDKRVVEKVALTQQSDEQIKMNER